jgi:hypothetical protein
MSTSSLSSETRTARPQRSAAKKAMEKITAIYAQYESDDTMIINEDNDDYSIRTTPVAHTPTPAPAKPTIAKITDCKSAPEYDALAQSKETNKANHVAQIKKYLDATDARIDMHINVPELMKYLILNPYIMIINSNFNTTVGNKMDEFILGMKTKKEFNNYIIGDQYRKEFLALTKIVAANSKVHSIINLSEPFYTDIDKIATEYEKAINSFMSAINPST